MNVINCSYLDVCSDGSVHQLTQSYQLITILGLDVTAAFIGLLKTPLFGRHSIIYSLFILQGG